MPDFFQGSQLRILGRTLLTDNNKKRKDDNGRKKESDNSIKRREAN
jgi:hypothetical protein